MGNVYAYNGWKLFGELQANALHTFPPTNFVELNCGSCVFS